MFGSVNSGPFLSILRFLGHNVIRLPRVGIEEHIQIPLKEPNVCISIVEPVNANGTMRNAPIVAIRRVAKPLRESPILNLYPGDKDR